MSAWDRQPQEPPRAFQHFCTYRDLGPERTLEKVGKHWGVSQSLMEQESARWNWTGRSDQWDAHVQSTHDRAYLTEAARQGRTRAQAHRALLGKALEALRQLDLSKVKLSEIASAVKVASEGMRLEEGLETARVSMELTDARTILSRLPAEVRTPLLRALAEQSGPDGDPGPAGGVPLGLGE
jgi:hypothetical protein